MADTPAVPLTLEGSWVLHQMFRWRRREWREVNTGARDHVMAETTAALSSLEKAKEGGHPNQSALYSLIGHKGDLMLIHFRDSLLDLHCAEQQIARLAISDYLQPVHSYLSVVELGLYESSAKTYSQLAELGLEPHSPEWNARVADVIARQTAAMSPRLFPEIPPGKYICFYPMDRKRGESKNWYQEPMAERQRMMHEHGLIGRRYADSVRQIITGSIGFDDWEWGVDLFADDPLVFKKLIYEMRFDEVSAVYALFGDFYVGVRITGTELPQFLNGSL
ncbi:MAG: heme-dependent peroxidase [Acidobacteriaceae bacterium]|nr:heme-dependent peroxidase [Acidobacteriaceae bacterium]MBV9036408.1 heme-dependent peroxidase [Acidobacteriaceae bacterium]MBV9304824.1 heme-dependent peroxidase [Acidobacteriaceae bacterium]